ncbi:MAG: flagellin [Thermoplasmata archaeon]|nr:MAG: flagellin [Thermoplasmata archaeon]
MIVFIAMVLVAGIAASVLVQTANRLEIQAMQTGDQTRQEVSTGIRVCDIEGQYSDRHINASGTWHNHTRIHNMTITIAPRAGSGDIDLDEAVLEISNSSVKCILTWDGSTYANSVSSSGVFATSAFELSANEFGIIELEDADSSSSSSDPVINRGDRVMLTVNLTACFWGLPERTDVWGMVIPEEGAPGIFAFRTPSSYSDIVYDLY